MEKFKVLLETWDIRILMLCSLGIQAILTILAPYRKRCSNSFIAFLLWFLYLSADAVALFTIGLIASSQDAPTKTKHHKGKAKLLAFWAPFLLLHLGGPDTITALALEDNELWDRHVLQLVTQAVVTFYVFVISFHRNHLLFPTVLMFFDGLIKYFERTCALYFASMETFRDSQRTKPEPGPNYARLMEEYSSALNAYIPTEIKGKDGPSDHKHEIESRTRTGIESVEGGQAAVEATDADHNATILQDTDEMILDAYGFYEKFKGLIADAFLSLKDRDESRAFYFNKCKLPSDAFRMVQIELNFMYDVFYTKVFLLQRKRGYARIICIFSVVLSLFLFCFKDKSNYQPIDVGITYTLLGGAIALDLFATFVFLLSDWWVVTAHHKERPKLLTSLLVLLLRCSRRTKDLCCSRWSESVSSYNLLIRCLKDPHPLFNYIFIRRIQDLLIGWWYVDQNLIDDQLVNFIVVELYSKAQLATDTWSIDEVSSARGHLVFQDEYLLVAEYLSPWTVDVDYDASLLTWHFATDICYRTGADKHNKYVKFSKTLSEYMSYLILRQQALVSPVVGISDTRFDDTCAEAKKFMSNLMLHPSAHNDQNEKISLIDQFCARILEVQTPVRPILAKGDKSKSVLFDSCCLAKQLKMFGDKQWEITSKVWVELLCYAAVRCSPRTHVALLSKGGELITLLWLLMTHLGLGERFRQDRGFGWTKLIIHK